MTDEDAGIETLLTYLKESRGFDFTGYKRASLSRRINRRLSALAIDGPLDYLDYLQVHPEEFTALFNTILINVTEFFRDIEAWDHLRGAVLPSLLASRSPTEPIRVWSAGCATGEEAYSLAIAMCEVMGADDFRERVKIYATDVDEDALGQARHAHYGEQTLANVSADLRGKYFDRQPDGRLAFPKGTATLGHHWS